MPPSVGGAPPPRRAAAAAAAAATAAAIKKQLHKSTTIGNRMICGNCGMQLGHSNVSKVVVASILFLSSCIIIAITSMAMSAAYSSCFD